MLNTNKFFLSLIAVVFFHYGYFCQNTYQSYQFPKEIPKNYVVDAKQDYEKLKLITKPTNASKEEIEGYCEFITYSKQNLFNTGGVYFNWAELENYLNTVLKNILPDSLKNNNALHVYPARKADFNAFAISDGSLFVNIGYLSEIPNEASLASTMGHEITHYLKHDTYESYFRQLEKDKTEKKAKNYEQALTKKLDKAGYERSQEVVADSLGYLFAHNGNYNVENSLTDFYLLLMQEQLDEKANRTKTLVNVGSKKDTIGQSKGKLIFQLLSDHPGSKERMEMIYRFLKAHPTSEKKDFIQEKDLFLKLKQQARYEKLNILMEENNYYDCMLSAFTYYMQNPNDKIYNYYLLESLRKFIYTEENITLEKGFLNMHLRGLLKYNKGILHNIRLVSPDTAYVKSIKAFDLADTNTIEFENYYQAFDYFLNEAMKKNVTEAYLIAAQKNYDDDEIRQAYTSVPL